ncbi:helix-turn-helix domain-containing protein [Caldimonas tepidiphila]|uniref:helix-turn-helix domain-containing protein n=1 Tax=Caldimonas tepidiphila TaxID=2315841 RepID=UPI000E5C196F|nr:helix-turn-helix domain-containing protein [Caldimonas tepidiphila]
MKPVAPLAIPFREVRHSRPDDCLHYESIDVRGRLHQWHIPAHRHEGLHQLQLVERGAALATIDGVQHELRAPAALLIAPGTVHGFVFEPACAGHQLTLPSALLQSALGGVPEFAARLASGFLLGGEQIGADMSEGVELFVQLAREFELARPGRVEALQAQAVLLALWFLRHAGEPRADEHRQALRDTLVQRYRSLLELHYRQHRPVSFYAGALQVTADHLSRACRSVAGRSALELMHERMHVEARRLLAYTEAPVAEIALELGFDDPGYFSRFFARLAGQSPSAYRAEVASGRGVRPGTAG